MKLRILGMTLLAVMNGTPLALANTQISEGPAPLAKDPLGAETRPARSANLVMWDLKRVSAELTRLFPPEQSLADQTFRAKVAPAAIPVLRQMVRLLDEAATISPQSKAEMTIVKYRFLGTLSLLEDTTAQRLLEMDAASPQKETALLASLAQLSAKWLKNSTDAASQAEILDQVEKITQENSSSNIPSIAAFNMYQLGAASLDLQDRAKKIAVVESTSPFAKQQQQKFDAETKILAYENKPMDIHGKTLDGKEFTSATYKGKVVLVDFWATWCGPCREELPRIKALYKQYHDKGLEIVGVSCDLDQDALKNFIKAEPDMSWIELSEAGGKMNPVALQYGIETIPKMFLIDRNGVCRSVQGREKMEELLPTLLGEVPSAKPAVGN